MAEVGTTKQVQGPENLLKIINGIRRQGFLDYVGSLWATYGDLFRLKLGSRGLIFALHPEAVRHVNISNRQNYDKLHSYDVVRKFLIGDGLIASTGDLWRRQRRLLAPFYTPRGVQAYADIMLRDSERVAARWDRLAGGGTTVEMAEEMTFVTASIILRTMFSMEASEDIITMKDSVETMIAFTAGSQGLFPRLPLWMPSRANRDYAQARERVHTYINGVIGQRRAVPEREWPDDLLSRLMQARDEDTGETMSESLLRDESITTFFAGHETTARTLTFAWYALAANPDVATRLQQELDSVLADRVPTVDDLHRLPYTLQIIKETLRLYPPAPFYIRDAVAGDVFEGFEIPAGSSVMLSPYFTHRHSDFWEEPLRFNPDRWTPEREAAQHPYAYHPFAAGQRICIGNNFSLLESHILLALLAREFAPRRLDGFEPRWVMQGTLGTSNGMPMIIERRPRIG